MDETNARMHHERTGNFWPAWRSVAEDLLAAADVLKQHHDTFDVNSLPVGSPIPSKGRVFPAMLMLRGMAFECLLKALWLKRDAKRTLVVSGKYRGIPDVDDHNLSALANATQFKTDKVEKHLLRRLSAFIKYGGRYPVATTPEALRMIKYPSGGHGEATAWTSPGDERTFAAILKKLLSGLG
jgi:hypothetical protein